MKPPVVHIVDDDEPLRSALAGLLAASGYETRAYASAGQFLLGDVSAMSGCVLLDLRLDGPSGLDLQDAIAQRGAKLPIVFMSAHGDVAASVRAMKAGAVDFLEKPVERVALLAAVGAALAREAAQSATDGHLAGLRTRYESLTPRERDVLQGIVAGRLNKQIAHEMGIVERTVKAHRASIMQKLDADSPAVLGRIVEQLRHAGAIDPVSGR